jgi:hypothetical protein
MFPVHRIRTSKGAMASIVGSRPVLLTVDKCLSTLERP